MSNHVSQGSAHFDFGGKHEHAPLNALPQPDILGQRYRMFIDWERLPAVFRTGCCVGINRFSNLRYYKDNHFILWSPVNSSVHGYVSDNWLAPPDHNIDDLSRDQQNRRIYKNYTYPMGLTASSLAVAGMCSRMDTGYAYGDYNGSHSPLATSIDLPGTTIGNIFKHPIGRAAWFNEVGQIATMQGDIQVLGVYDPPEPEAYTNGFQVYFTKSGGTGEPVLDTNVDSGTLASNVLSDSGYNFVAADVGRTVRLVDSATAANNRTLRIANVVGVTAVLCDGYGAITWSTVATMTTTVPHGLATSDSVSVYGSTGYDGTYTITVTGDSTFTFAHADAGADSGTWILDLADDAVAFNWEMRSDGQGATGQVVDADEFSDDYYAFVAGDVGKYIVINTANNKIITEIKSVAAGVATVDSSDINQDLAADTDIYWQLRSGPIAEYFVRKRRWIRRDDWINSIFTGNGGGHALYAMDGARVDRPSALSMVPTVRTLHDRGVCWWGICDATYQDPSYAPWGLWRQKDLSNQGYDWPYLDGDFGGLDLPAGILSWRDLGLDHDNKIWIATDDQVAATGYSVFRVDPYPGGNALNPSVLLQLSVQANMASAGLPSAAAMGIACDEINDHIWIACGDDGATGGGLYRHDGTAMIDLVHEKSALTGTDSWNVAGDGITVTNPATDASLDTELVAGEWITFNDGLKDESKRQIASITDSDTLVLTAVTAFGGADTGLTMKKGALNTDQLPLYFLQHSSTTWSDYSYVPPPLVVDSGGRVTWRTIDAVNDPDIVRFDPATTAPASEFNRSDITAGYGSTGKTFNITVSKPLDVAGAGASIWYDNIWCGRTWNCDITRIYDWVTYEGTGTSISGATFSDSGYVFTDDDVGKWVKITNSATDNGIFKIASQAGGVATLTGASFTGDTALNWEFVGFTRYENGSGTNFPETVELPYSGEYQQPKILTDDIHGELWMHVTGQNGDDDPRMMKINTAYPDGHSELGLVVDQGLYHSPANESFRQRGTPQSASFDTLGMGVFQNMGHASSRGLSMGSQSYPHWACMRWDGSGWENGRVGQLADLDFDGSEAEAGPIINCDLAVGAGVKRVTDWPEELVYGLWLQFDQAGGGTAQAAEYPVDETITWLGVIGRAKDNTMTASWFVDSYMNPTVVRLDEPVVDMGSLWTLEGGVDGGYNESADDQAFPTHRRGISECSQIGPNGTGDNYPTTAKNMSSTHEQQFMACRRIYDESGFPLTGDLTLVDNGGQGEATSASREFIAGDVGKTIRVESATDGGNNTSRVITAISGSGVGNTAIVDAAWAVAPDSGGAVDWRLRDIPKVGYILLPFYTRNDSAFQNIFNLLSSRDMGHSWDQVKTTGNLTTGGPLAYHDPMSDTMDAGVYPGMNCLNTYNIIVSLSDADAGRYILFDIRDLPEHQRRRSHWKIWRNGVLFWNDPFNQQGVTLFDEDFVPMGPASLFPSDRTDPLFQGWRPVPKVVAYESSNPGVGSSLYPFAYTDTITEAGANYYLQNKTDAECYAGTSTVKSATAAFTIADKGRRIRIPDADIDLGVDETYDGFSTIVDVVDANTVTIDRTFDSQSTGAITAFADGGGGQVVVSSAAHGLANNDAVTITGTTNYDGTYIISNIAAGTYEITATWVSDDATGTWNQGQIDLDVQTLDFGGLDHLRFQDGSTIYKHLGNPLNSVTFIISDIPTQNTIVVSRAEIPVGVSSAFWVERDFETSVEDHWSTSTGDANWDTKFSVGIGKMLGVANVSDEARFMKLYEDDTTRSAGSSADADGDHWTDEITLTGFNLTDLVQGDWILLYDPATEADPGYRRWYQIDTITPGANTVIKVYEDEIKPGETFKWRIGRNPNRRMRMTNCVIVGKHPITP